VPCCPVCLASQLPAFIAPRSTSTIILGQQGIHPIPVYITSAASKNVSPLTAQPTNYPSHADVFPLHDYLTFIHHTYDLTLTMAQKFLKEDAELAESPRPITSGSQESVHPSLHPSLMKVPVTPGIHLGEYDTQGSGDSQSYFTHDISKLQQPMAQPSSAQSPSEAASGAKSNRDILRRMSLAGGPKRQDSLNDIDPRAAFSSLGLSGGIISATFCIPHSLQYRKGADWVHTHLVSLGSNH
jgi:hypothetical protein